jgi:hypothetical protein
LFYLFTCIASNYRCLDTTNFNNLQDLEAEAFEQQAGKEGKCPWLVLLESGKDWFLGVDPPLEQSVTPLVWNGMTCLLISDTSGSSLGRRMVREHL